MRSAASADSIAGSRSASGAAKSATCAAADGLVRPNDGPGRCLPRRSLFAPSQVEGPPAPVGRGGLRLPAGRWVVL